MKLCLSQATTLSTSFAADVRAYAEAGWKGMEVWLTKLETHLESHSAAATQRLLVDHGLALPAASYQGGLLVSQGEQRRAHFDHFRRRLDLCQQFGIATLVVVADFLEPIDVTSLERAVVSLREAGQWAEGFGVQLALEFRSTSRFAASYDTAAALVGQAGQPNIGVALDAFHFFTGPSKLDDLDLVRPLHVQLCDVAGIPRELAADSDRVLPGDGDFRLDTLVAKLRQVGYDGWLSLELLNPLLWNIPPAHLAELALAALQRLIDQP